MAESMGSGGEEPRPKGKAGKAWEHKNGSSSVLEHSYKDDLYKTTKERKGLEKEADTQISQVGEKWLFQEGDVV